MHVHEVLVHLRVSAVDCVRFCVLVMNYFKSVLVSDWVDFCLIDDNCFGRLVSHTRLASF